VRIAVLNMRWKELCAQGQAFADGLARHGVNCARFSDGERPKADVIVTWGWRRGKQHMADGARVIVMERGYIGDRFAWTSLGVDGLNGRARFPVRDDGGDRFRRLGFDQHLKPECPRGAYALVCGQVRGDAAVEGVDLGKWYRQAALALQTNYGSRVVFRAHPKAKDAPGNSGLLHGMIVQAAGGSLEDAFEHADCVAAYNSNAPTEAAMAGIPVIAGDEGAMVWPIAGQGLDDRPRLFRTNRGGSRSAWAHRMAWRQWSLDEMASGEAWEALAPVVWDDAARAEAAA